MNGQRQRELLDDVIVRRTGVGASYEALIPVDRAIVFACVGPVPSCLRSGAFFRTGGMGRNETDCL